ncbi:hypothetical protein CDV31_008765 [Fusarium ambrosium]|uniref:Uncharacterized protein n=1 Tax=Fusarium ambrosium TaxID=131363 RepID=A0A428TYN7_9HYPO|nr:hypothetical protein CDV31_008765 [Fusarium ambrosium]
MAAQSRADHKVEGKGGTQKIRQEIHYRSTCEVIGVHHGLEHGVLAAARILLQASFVKLGPLRISAFPLPFSGSWAAGSCIATVDIVIVVGSCLPLIELESRSDLLDQLTMSLPHDQFFDLTSPMRTRKTEALGGMANAPPHLQVLHAGPASETVAGVAISVSHAQPASHHYPRLGCQDAHARAAYRLKELVLNNPPSHRKPK